MEFEIDIPSKNADDKDLDIKKLLMSLAEKFCCGNDVKNLFKDILLVSVQHILGTTFDMLTVMKKLGLEHAIIGGKSYSTHKATAKKIMEMGFTYVPDAAQLGYGHFDDAMSEVVQRIWIAAIEKLKITEIKKIIILDDGADLLRSTPGSLFLNNSDCHFVSPKVAVIGIEQTRGGTNHPAFEGLPFPIINVAGSFVKAKIEYPHVAEKIAQKIKNALLKYGADKNKNTLIGILGYGTMGKAIANVLTQERYSLLIHDRDKAAIAHLDSPIKCTSAPLLISNADIVIGCTGTDLTSDEENLLAIMYRKNSLVLINTGSKDTEYNTLLRLIQKKTKQISIIPDPLKDIELQSYLGATISVIRGGFPINFDNSLHSVHPRYIWTTRAALLLACISAAQMSHQYFERNRFLNSSIMLSKEAQLLIFEEYTGLASLHNIAGDKLALNEIALAESIQKFSEGFCLDSIMREDYGYLKKKEYDENV